MGREVRGSARGRVRPPGPDHGRRGGRGDRALDPKGRDRARAAQAAGQPRRLRPLPARASARLGQRPRRGREALRLLDEALALDPGYAAAHGLAAWCHQQRFVRYTRDPADREAALRHARAALATGADDPAALALSALVVAISDRDYATASSALGRALAINPSSALGWGVRRSSTASWATTPRPSTMPRARSA